MKNALPKQNAARRERKLKKKIRGVDLHNPMPRVKSLEQLATAAVAARLARESDGYLSQVVAAAPLSLISPCLSTLRDPLALAAVEDACRGEEEARNRGSGAGGGGASSSSSFSSSSHKLLEVHWERLFLERFGGASGSVPSSRQPEELQKKDSDLDTLPSWRRRYEAAEAAERRRLEALGARLRERGEEEAARRRARAVVVLAAPPRPRGGSLSGGNVGRTKRSAIDPRQRIEKKLARRKTAGTATATARAVAAAAAAASAAAAAAAARAPSSSFPNLARPLVRPGNEAQRIVRRASGSSGGIRGAIGGPRGGGVGAAVFPPPRGELQEAPLFD